MARTPRTVAFVMDPPETVDIRADTTFVLATIPSVPAFVRPATFLTSILTIITICKLYVLLGVGRPSLE